MTDADAGAAESDEMDEYDAEPIPSTVRWDELDACRYRVELRVLSEWVGWLVTTYRLQSSVVPPCWYRHRGHLETLSHLQVAWKHAHHPDAGVGFIAADWDGRRVSAVDQLRDLTAVYNCDSTRHTEPAPISWLNRPAVAVDFEQHLAGEATSRDHAGVTSAGTAAALDALAAADNRPATADPGNAVDDAVAAAQQTRGEQAHTQQITARTAALTAARDALAQLIGDGIVPDPADPTRTAWETAGTGVDRPVPPAAAELPASVVDALDRYHQTP